MPFGLALRGGFADYYRGVAEDAHFHDGRLADCNDYITGHEIAFFLFSGENLPVWMNRHVLMDKHRLKRLNVAVNKCFVHNFIQLRDCLLGVLALVGYLARYQSQSRGRNKTRQRHREHTCLFHRSVSCSNSADPFSDFRYRRMVWQHVANDLLAWATRREAAASLISSCDVASRRGCHWDLSLSNVVPAPKVAVQDLAFSRMLLEFRQAARYNIVHERCRKAHYTPLLVKA